MAQKILLIEDNPILTELYRSALEEKKLEVLITHDGEKGIEIAKNQQPALILLDLLMIGIDGYEVLKKLKEADETKNIKVIILSVINDQASKDKAKKLGASDYLIKSEIEISEIVRAVMAQL